MARRPRARVDTSRLRAMGETSAVVARPVDTYVRPAAPQKNQQYAQILSALSTVNPALDNFITDKVTKDREKQANLGEKSFYEATPEERKAMSAKIKSGEINELQSPFWVEGFARQLLRNHASTFGSALTLEWNKKKDSGGFDFNAFVAEERGKYVEANNLSSFRSDLFNDEFAAVTQTYERQVQQRNFEHRISQAKKARMRAWGDGMVGILEGVQTTINDKTFFDPIGGEESDSKGSLNFSGQINAHVQAIIDQGQDPKAVVQMAENFLTGTSERLANKGDRAGAETVLRMLNGLKLNVGTFGIVYKDRFAQAERNVTQLIDASEKRQDEDDETKGENRIGELFDDMQKAGDEAKWTQEWWDSTQDDRRELQRLNQEYGGSQGSALNDLYTNRGKVTQKTDPLVISELTSDITDPKEVLDSEDIRAMAEVAGLTPRETADLIALNNNLDEQLLNDLGLDTIRSDLKNSVMGANTSGGFGPNPEKALIAGKATAELNDFIRQQLTKRSRLTDTEIATRIQGKADTLLQKYSNMTTNVSSGNPPDGNPLVQPPPPPAGTEDGDPIVPATLKEVQSFIGGQQTPYLKPNGEFDTTFFNLDLLQAYAEAANNPTQDASKTELGQKIAYLVAGGHATPNEILGVLTAAHEKAKGVSTEAAAKAVVEADNAASTRSTREPVSASKFAEELVDRGTELVSELISGDETANPTPQDFLDFLKENGIKIPKNSDEFYDLPSDIYAIIKDVYGVEAFKGDDGAFSDDKIQAIFDGLNKIDRAASIEASLTGVDDRGRGTFIPSLEEKPSAPKDLLVAEEAEGFAGTNVPSEPPLSDTERLQREARSMTPMDINQDPDFANIVSKADQNKLTYTATPDEIEAMNDVLGKTDLDNMNEVAARVQAVYPDINEQQLRDIIKRVSDYRAADGSTAGPVGVDMSVPSMVAPASSMQSPSMSSSSPDGAVNTGVAPKSGSSMMPASFKTQLPEAGSAGQAVTLDEEDAKILRGILRDQSIAEFKAKRAENAAAVKMERTARQDAMRMQRNNVSKKEAAKAEEERQNKLRIEREERQQEYLRKQTIRRSKTIAKIIAERAKKYPEKYGATMSDDLASYLNKTKPLWSNYWDSVLADGEEIPAVFYDVLKENMRKRISND